MENLEDIFGSIYVAQRIRGVYDMIYAAEWKCHRNHDRAKANADDWLEDHSSLFVDEVIEAEQK
tara:strand:+ start:1324 stop:1515 length:192 start_codon:yes stop_codon:yes gene_type:complete